jgi:3-dehydroquinate synthase
LATVEKVCRALHRAGADRHSVIAAVGGGVVGDVAGFAAASYLRGVRLIHVPTTLVAQIDSSIGGKTGVNLPEGKNLVGAFYPPVAVVADPRFLQTLPEAQFRSGLYEGVKYANIVDAKFFNYLETNMGKVLHRDPRSLEWLILRSIRAKAEIVSKDEREAGVRQVLNFGHTFGHALETAGNYRGHLHGEAVGWGMLVATLLALATNRINSIQAQRISRLVMSVSPLPSFDSYRPAKLLALMRGDKKSHGGRVRWVLPVAMGRVEWGVEIADRLVIEAIREAPEVARLAEASR